MGGGGHSSWTRENRSGFGHRQWGYQESTKPPFSPLSLTSRVDPSTGELVLPDNHLICLSKPQLTVIPQSPFAMGFSV